MSEEEKKLTETQQTPEETTPQTPAPEPPQEPKESKAPLNDQKKNALLRYMAVLFGVAFLLVALSFLIQIRDSSVTITQLNQSNASALQNAEKLQSDNRDLTAENKRLNQELHDLQTSLDDAEDRLTDAEQTVDDLSQAMKESEALAQIQEQNNEALAAAAQARLEDDKGACRASLSLISQEDAPMVGASKTLLDTLIAWSTETAD